jgi:tetratricopeptide (TPR) repeat protein
MSSAETPAPTDLDAEQGELVETFLRCRRDAAEGSDAKAKRALQKATGKLDALYWKRVGALVEARVRPEAETLSFSDEERLLIDMGLLDEALVADAAEGLTDALLAELNAPGAFNHYYLSEWLEERYRRQRLQQAFEEEEAEAAGPQESAEVQELQQARGKVYNRLKPYFDGLPGVNEQVVTYVTSGQLDDQVQMMGLNCLDHRDRPVYLRRHALRNLRLGVLNKLRARLRQDRDLKLVDMLDVIYTRLWHQRYQVYEEHGNETAEAEGESELASPARRKLVEFLQGELRFARSLLPLGALAGGIPRACSVLLEDRGRITKAATQDELDRARAIDRDFNADPLVVIAPFQGRGFFEWDRDSLFVPLVPVETPEDAIAHAAGNYRVLIDWRQQGERLKGLYEETFEGARFQDAFQADYRAWISQIGRGRAAGMAPDHFRFFREHIGPDCSGVLAPANLRNLGPDARGALRKRLEKQLKLGTVDVEIHHRLGVLYWEDGDLERAAAQLSKAVSLQPREGLLVFSLGLVLRRLGRDGQARKAFELCRQRAPESLWAVYAGLALEDDL